MKSTWQERRGSGVMNARTFLGFGAVALASVAALTAVASATVPTKNGKIAFKRYLDRGHSTGAIFTIDVSGKAQRRITRPKGVVDDQPDSRAESTSASERKPNTKIAFSCSGDICLMNSDGSDRTRLTRDKWINSYPAWSPDGQRIGFTGNLGRTVVIVMNADGSARLRLTRRHGNEALAAWSPDGRTIALDNNKSGKIDVMNADGSHRRALTRRPASLPTWSPDGRRIAFVSRDGRRLALTSGDIWAINADGSGQRRLAQDGSFPAWSPDGTRIAFIRNTRRSTEAAIWIMNADGTGQRRVWPHSARGAA